MRERILEYEYRAAAPLLELWFGEAMLCRTLREELERDSDGARIIGAGETVDRLEEGDRFVIDLDEEHRVIALYQRQAENEVRPNLVLLHHSFAMDEPSLPNRLRHMARSIFPGQELREIRFFQYGEQTPARPEYQVHSHYVAGLVRDVAATPLSGGHEGLRVEQPESLAFYETYHEWYLEFWRRRPDLKPLVRAEPRDDLKDCFEEGGLRLLMMHDEPCGVIAAERRTEFGLIGWRMREKLVAPSHWGLGLSVAANILFARDLPAEPHEAMWGTIAPTNQASLRSAQRVGRGIIGSTQWIDVPAQPSSRL